MIKSNAWIDKYKPKTVEECFLPEATYSELKKYLNDVPNMLFAGPPGIGKTTVAEAICNEGDFEFMMINASLTGIDVVRNDITNFSSTVSLNGKKKIIILDEADGLTAAAQSALRGIINEFKDNISFILTANFSNKIIEPLISRLISINFLFEKSEIPKLAQGLYSFLITRLSEESVEYDDKAVKVFIRDNLMKSTDIRKILLNAQRIAKTGIFNSGSLINQDNTRLQEVIKLLKDKDFNGIRNWVGENSDITNSDITRYIYDNISDLGKGKNICILIALVAEYQYKHAFVADPEINNSAMLLELSLNL